MKNCKLGTFLILLVLALVSKSNAQEDPWSLDMNPSGVHEFLKQFEGDWKEEVTIWMDPTQPAQKFRLNSVNKMILGGRFQESTASGDMGGMKFEAISLLSYNTISRQFQLTSINNIGTGTLSLEGSWTDSLKTITFNGEMTDPMSKKKLKVKQVLKFISTDEYLIENFDQRENGISVKSMEYRFKRK